MKSQYPVFVESILAENNVESLSSQVMNVAHELSSGTYSSHLNVSFDYWHYGRHAEFALELGMVELASLFRLAWQHDLNIRIVNSVIEMEENREILRKQFPQPNLEMACQ